MAEAVVTGGAGFIGRHLVNHLLWNGWKVIVVDSGVTGQINKLPKEANLLARDIASLTISDWADLIPDKSYVFHLAAHKHNTPGHTAADLARVNIAATWNLAKASAAKDVRRLVFTSSLYAHGGLGPRTLREGLQEFPRTLYGISKRAGEDALFALGDTDGLSWNAARLFFTYGPGQFAEGGYKSVIVKTFERIKSGHAPIVNGSGRQVLDYIYVSDVVDALLELAVTDTQREIVNVCSGSGRTILSMIEEMQLIAGAPGPLEAAPADWTEGTSRVGSRQKVDKTLRWRPQIDISAGLRMTWESLS